VVENVNAPAIVSIPTFTKIRRVFDVVASGLNDRGV